jgi:copper chaperone NosL
MKALGGALAAAMLAVAAVILWPAAGVGPEAIVHGRDACARCRMPISRPGFGGELRDRSGVLTKYDDVGCMLRAMLAMHADVPEAWVEDHRSFELVPLLGATLARGRTVETPMASGLVAFRDPADAAAFVRDDGGDLVPLEALLREPARIDGAATRRADAAEASRR